MTNTLRLASRLKLADGNEIPRLGLGVYEMSDAEAHKAVLYALEAGYRQIDCAEWYYNEAAVGNAIQSYLSRPDCPISRKDIFYTTKLQSNRGYDAAKKSIKQSLAKCGLDYIDLYLIHSPYGGKQRRLESWKAMEEAKDAGIIKSIGVSNYGERHIEELLSSNPKHKPVVNQCDLHPFMARLDLVKYCRSKDIALQAWGPLVRAERFDDPTVQSLSKKHKVTPAQILIRYALQSDFITIPKSVSKDRIVENVNVFSFTLDQQDMESLLKLDEYYVTDWDPIGDRSV